MIKYCRYIINDVIKYGRVEDNEIFTLEKEPWYNGKETGETISLSKVRILSPSEPKVIIGLGDSYSTAWEGKDPPRSVRWFIKPPGSAASWNDDILLPAVLNEVKVEVELVIVIGSITKNVSEEEADNSIFGYTIGNDIVGTTDSYYRMTKEKTEYHEKLLATGLKICDGFAPLGPFVYKDITWHDKTGKLIIIDKKGNQRIIYENPFAGLLYSPAKIVSDLSKVLTLFPGDVIMTGTTRSFPAHPGETVAVTVDGMGLLKNKIKVFE